MPQVGRSPCLWTGPRVCTQVALLGGTSPASTDLEISEGSLSPGLFHLLTKAPFVRGAPESGGVTLEAAGREGRPHPVPTTSSRSTC